MKSNAVQQDCVSIKLNQKIVPCHDDKVFELFHL